MLTCAHLCLVVNTRPRAQSAWSMNDQSTPTYLETLDVSRRLNCGKERIRQLVARGDLPVAGHTVRGSRLFDLHTVDRIAAERASRREAGR